MYVWMYVYNMNTLDNNREQNVFMYTRNYPNKGQNWELFDCSVS